MPKSKMWPYPLRPGTRVVAKVRRLDLNGDETVVGTIVRTLKAPRGNTVTYVVLVKDGMAVQVLASRTEPIDTTTADGLEKWLDLLDTVEPDASQLPMPAEPSNEAPNTWMTADDVGGNSMLRTVLYNGPYTANTTNTLRLNPNP